MPPPRDGATLLAPLLKARRPLLLAGAGASAKLGYPTWAELVKQLADEFAPTLQLSDDYLGDVDKIKAHADDTGRSDEYFKRLDRLFCPDPAQGIDSRFHRQLISLGFCGLITTNFDQTLEHACIAEYTDSTGPHRCESVDLRADRPYLVFDFLRGLGASPRHTRVLHLHGLHSLPKRLILGARDYADAYGHELSAPDAALRTLPRKIIWTLLAIRPVLFVGFSMRDPFFRKTLNLVRTDFLLTDEPAHFSIMPYEVDVHATAGALEQTSAHEEAKERIRARLPSCIVPIFYYAPVDPVTRRQDHSLLPTRISELWARARTSLRPETVVDRLARRTLEEI